jgi:hypothetical protein
MQIWFVNIVSKYLHIVTFSNELLVTGIFTINVYHILAINTQTPSTVRTRMRHALQNKSPV